MAIDLDVHGNTKPLEAAVQAAINRIRRQPIKITVDDKGATQPLGNMKRAADEFSKSMEAANARILAFGASMAIINGVADAFKGMVRNLVEVEKSLADINVVMGLSTQNLDKFGDGLFKVAKETGAAFRVAADAATEYARQGLSMEESLKRTRDALILTRLTGMDSAEAVKSLTAAMNTYGNQIKDTTQLVSKFAAVDVQFAVSAEDFAAAISRTGQAAKTAGVDIDELIGIVTSAQQQTARGGAVIGNALKTIFTKTGRTDTLNQLEDLGIAVRDLEGNTIGAKRILTDLANTFDTLSEAQKSQITQTMGGLFHINILKAVLSDAAKQNGILARATEISSSATDEAVQKNQQLRETMSAMATETGLAIKQVSAQIGEIALAPGMEKILNTVKSLAEGLSGVLGDGEGVGNKFATGFLKGVGNIITGPGLVILTTVFVKLFMTAAKFTKESLSSLIGVTTEAQKQKAIQTSLVALIGQNAALGKEMLRTDISRTEKEKILLGLLKMQTAEAERLNAVSQKLAATLYTRGYGPGLTQGKRRAYGHIPNFADPERAQAARGGYAAGSIRTMNMPGEGSVIYNSAETVKNFAGFKQPAIMPPQSSKAGKNYQQAFGSIHGFDPYAAGGYIPNYAKAATYNKDGKMVLFAASTEGAGSYAGRDRRNNIIYLNPSSMKFSKTDDGKGGMVPVNVPYFTIGRSDAERSKNDPKIKNKIQGDLVNQAQKTTNQLVNEIFKTPSIPNVIKSNDVAVAVGNVFEKILMSVQKGVAKEAYDPDPPGNALLDIPRGGRDALWDLFGASPLGSLGAEAKIALGSGGDAAHLKSAAEKFYKIDSYKGIGGAKAMAFAPAGKVSQKNLASLGYTSELQEYINKKGKTDSRVPSTPRNRTFANWPKGRYSDLESLKNDFYSKARAYGHIPNFADPLSDAIGREKAAGVPVSQIRVGSHSALMSKGNPLGLGVTNTYDEPNGLRDVFGANGFVPNYAFTAGDISGNFKKANAKLLDSINKKISSIDASIVDETEYRAAIDRIIASYTENGKSISLTNKGLKSADKITKQNTTEKQKNTSYVTKNTVSNQANTAASQKNTLATTANTAAKAAGTDAAMKNMGGMMGGMRGVAGMGMMMGLPMLAGFIPGADKPGSAGSTISNMVQGASTGYTMGVFLPGWGPAIAAGVGALYGLVKSLDESKQAVQEESEQRAKSFASFFPLADMVNKLSGPRGAGGITAGKFLGDKSNLLEKKTNVLNVATGEITDQQSIVKQTNPMLNRTVKDVLSQTLPSVPVSFEEFRQISKTLPSGQKTIDESQIVYGGGRDLDEALKNRLQSAQADLSKYNVDVKNIAGPQREIIFNLLDSMSSTVDMFPDLIKGEDGSISFSKESKSMQTYGQFAQKIAGMLEGEQGLENLDKVTQLLVEKMDASVVAQSKQNEAIILRLNKEKVLLSAQDKFNKDMRVSSNLLAEMNNQYDYELRTRGHLMTETEKAQNAYNKAINTAAAARYDAERKAEFGQTKKLITTLQGSDFEQEFKKELAAQGLSEQGFADLSVEDQKEIAIEVGKQSGHLQKINAFLRNSSQELSSLKEDYADVEQKAKNRAKTEQEITNELIRQKTGPGAMGRGMDAAFFSMREQVKTMDYELGKKIPYAFADGLANAMSEGLSGAKSIGDALRDSAISFLQMIQQAMLQKAAYSIVGAMGFSRGGNVRNYSRGGGVPAMVSNGEYVMGRDAVAKYGGSFMHGLNAGGKIPGYSNGGSALAANFGGGRGHASGRAYQSRAMSGFFYSQSGNVGLGEDTSTMMGILQEEERKRQEAEARRQAKKAKRRQLIGSLIGIAAGAAISKFAGGFGKGPSAESLGRDIDLAAAPEFGKSQFFSDHLTKNFPASSSFSTPKTGGYSSLVNSTYGGTGLDRLSAGVFGRYLGGPIRKYASGGYISGKSGIDQIPAMLSEGEYVIRASSARQLGKPMLDRINAGKFNEGGAVSELMGSSETASSGGNTNNINISINMERGSGSKKENQSQDNSGQNPADRSSDEQNSAALADRIKQQVVAVIVEEQRPGGLLSE